MLTYHITTFGCQMNFNDSERIARVAENLNFKKALEKSRADIIIFNTCAVRQSAEDRVLGIIPKIRKKNPSAKIIVTGCSIWRKDFREKMAVYCNNFVEILKLPSFLKKITENKREGTIIKEREDKKNLETLTANFFKIKPLFSSSCSAYIPIMTGCNNFCSYCIVPFTRGREFSRPPQDIIQETKRLVKEGYKEIFFLGQNVNSYNPKGSTKKEPRNFSDLLKKIDQIPGDFWIRFLTSHPKDMTDDLIKTVADSEKITNYIHLPFQSGSNKILRLMKRNYSIEHYLKLINKIQTAIPEASISTDIIVGFPGETEKDFKETAKIMRKVNFDMAYISAFSPRPGTVAATMKNEVPLEERKRRKKILTSILEKTALKNNLKYVGRTEKILVNKKIVRFPNKKSKKRKPFYLGKTETYKNVRLEKKPGQKIKIGSFQKVKIIKAKNFSLEGKLGESLSFPRKRESQKVQEGF
jgi:tRNA-2-methylthio-N6-dimethylallyladenosine synthase